MAEYKQDWFCKNCKKPFKIHLKKNSVAKEYDQFAHQLRNIINTNNWCFAHNPSLSSRDEYQWSFEPVDNLTQIELLAAQKEHNKRDTTR